MKYIQSQPHPQAGIGHQFHNWVLGLIVSNKFNCEFIHTPFTSIIRNGDRKNTKWDTFLNFGEGLKHREDINPKKIVNLPKLDLGHRNNFTIEQIDNRLDVWFNIVKNNDDNILFKLPKNQFIGVLSQVIYSECGDYLKDSYWSVNKRYDFKNVSTNVVVHIRRGDVSKKNNANRWLELTDYNKQIEYIRNKYNNVKFHVISEGNTNEFNLIKSDDVHLYINYDDLLSLNMMSSSDILITGLSSFSILASYLTKGFVFYNPLLNFTRWSSIKNFYNIKKYV